MIEKWNRIKAWLGTHAPHLVTALNPGATDEDFSKLEKTLGRNLPEPFKAFYRIHNGQNQHAEGIWAGEEFLSTERIAEEWAIWKQLLDAGEFDSAEVDPEEGIKNTWWSPGWIPITYDGAGNHDCLDLDPGEGGALGQVLRMWHDDAERYLVAGDLLEWADFLIDDLESGALVYSEEYGIMEADDPDWENED